MNTVQLPKIKACSTILADALQSGETAFIGQCGIGPNHELYLIVYEHVILAANPQKTWNARNCSISIDHYVDVEMIVKEKLHV